jgi:hypothetical protein
MPDIQPSILSIQAGKVARSRVRVVRRDLNGTSVEHMTRSRVYRDMALRSNRDAAQRQ